MIPPAALRWYGWLLRLYPPSFRAEYGEELQMVFAQALADRNDQPAWRLVWRELATAPPALIRLYWRELRQRGFQEVFFTSHLPVRDGRHSRMLAGCEVIFFLAWAGLLALLTYTSIPGLRPVWVRGTGLVGFLAVGLPLPFILLGLGRGLPRWVYPLFGSLIAYLCVGAWRAGMVVPLTVCMLAALALLIAAAWVNARQPLPAAMRLLGRSLAMDPLRWPFAVYGAAPILLLAAYDDGFTNSLTPCLLLSALGMLLGGLFYARLRPPLGRLAALILGLTLATWPSMLDRSLLVGSITPGDVYPVLGVWGIAMALMLLPLAIPGAYHEINRGLQKGG